MSIKKIWWPNSKDQLVKKTYQITLWLGHSPRPQQTFHPSVNLLGPESTSQRRPSWLHHWFLGVSVPILPGKNCSIFTSHLHNFGFFSPKRWKSSCRSVSEYSNFPDKRNSLIQADHLIFWEKEDFSLVGLVNWAKILSFLSPAFLKMTKMEIKLLIRNKLNNTEIHMKRFFHLNERKRISFFLIYFFNFWFSSETEKSVTHTALLCSCLC